MYFCEGKAELFPLGENVIYICVVMETTVTK
jgi:hypothetical protein